MLLTQSLQLIFGRLCMFIWILGCAIFMLLQALFGGEQPGRRLRIRQRLGLRLTHGPKRRRKGVRQISARRMLELNGIVRACNQRYTCHGPKHKSETLAHSCTKTTATQQIDTLFNTRLQAGPAQARKASSRATELVLEATP